MSLYGGNLIKQQSLDEEVDLMLEAVEKKFNDTWASDETR